MAIIKFYLPDLNNRQLTQITMQELASATESAAVV